MELSEILSWALGGGMVATLITLVTLKSTVLKAKSEAQRACADAEKARAEAETVRIANTEQATRILMVNIVEPLTKELNATRREMARLRKALNAASACDYHDSCPVLRELQQYQKNGETGMAPASSGEDDPADAAPDGNRPRYHPPDG